MPLSMIASTYFAVYQNFHKSNVSQTISESLKDEDRKLREVFIIEAYNAEIENDSETSFMNTKIVSNSGTMLLI